MEIRKEIKKLLQKRTIKVKEIILLLLSLMVSYFKNGCSLDVIERAKVTTEVDEMCGELLKGICQIMNVDYGAIFSYDRTTDTIHALRPGYYLTDEDIGFFNQAITEA